MVAPGAWGRELLQVRLAQPDRRSCGAAVLVVEEALRNERFARRLVAGGPAAFAGEVLAMHRRTTGAVDVAGRLQAPWTRVAGTPPWAVARHLSRRTGVPRSVVLVWPWRRGQVLGRVRAALDAGHPVPLFVGGRLMPRHVLLAVSQDRDKQRGGQRGGLVVYDPTPGRARRITSAQFVTGPLAGVGWPVPWFAVLPD